MASTADEIQLSPLGNNVGDASGDVHVQLEPDGRQGLRHRPSTRSNVSDPDDLLSRLPSRQLADAAATVMAGNTWRKKSKKRRPGYMTLRHKPEDPRRIASDLMHSEDFADAPEELQIENIKELPTNITNKKAVRAEVQASSKSKRPGVLKTMGYSASLGWKRFKQKMNEVSYSVDLWAGHLKKIDGHFGSGVTSYFLFLKWLFLLNVPVFLLAFSFITLPQLLHRYIKGGGYSNNTAFRFEHIFTGTGWLNETELYYGSYVDGNVGVIDNLPYEMPFAYLLTCGVYYITILIVTMMSVTRSYRRNYIEASDAFNFYYVSKVFSGWSFSVDNPETAQLKHKSIFKEFQEYLSGFRRDEEEQSCDQCFSLFLLRVATNLLIVGLLAGSAYLVWYISVTQSLSNKIAFLSDMALPLCISAINFVLPFAFSILASFEKYKSPKNELYITMVRTIVLNIVTLGVLIYFWFSSVDCSKRDENDQKWLDSELECRPCWENFMGENLYRLVIVDFIFILVITFLSEFVRRLMSQFCCKSLGYPEFNIGRNTLSLIYSQGLVWLGTFYSPMLSFIMAIKLLVIFYVKRFSVMQNCVPSVKPWRGGRTHTVIMSLLFMFYIICFGSMGYSIVFLKPSEVCGPYQGYNASYEVITSVIDDWKNRNEQANRVVTIIVELLTSVGFVLLFFIVICIAAHYARVVSNGYKDMVRLLRKQIAMEGKDKAFLLKLLQQASKAAAPVTQTPNNRPTTQSVTPASGKQFAKYTVPTVSHSPSGTPVSRRRGTPQSAVQSAPPPPQSAGSVASRADSTHQNLAYLDTSHDLSGLGDSTQNPMYPQSKSPVHRPDLPYPTSGASQYMSPGDERL